MLHRDVPFRFIQGKQEARWFSSAPVREDFDLWLRIVSDGYLAYRLELPLTYLYKAPYGASGLSGDLWKMEKARLNVYWQHFRERRLCVIDLVLFVPWSIVKYLYRLVITSIQNKANC